MKKHISVLGLFLTAIIVVITSTFNHVQSNQAGAPSGRTGSPRDGGSCISCHSPSNNFSGTGTITSNIPAAGYTAGQTYTITASVTRTGHSKFGFEVSPQDTTSSHNLTGSLVVTNTNTTHLAATNYITHTSAGTAGSNNSNSWSFNWTAPATNKGPVIFYGAFNVTNSNNNDTGDSIFLSNLKVYECPQVANAGTISGTASVCAGSTNTYSVTAVTGATGYTWTLPSGWSGSSTTNSISTVAGSAGGNISVKASNACTSSLTASSLTLSVNPVTTASVSIATAKDTVCAGSNVTFTATPTNGGTSPAYQWKLNGNNAGTGGTTFATTGLVNSDHVSCVMTSDLACVTQSPATSNTITMTVTQPVAVSVNVSSSEDTICSGTAVNFTATPANGGTSPSYQWKLNSNNVGTGLATYSNSALVNTDKVSCVLTSGLSCISNSPATSNLITMNVTPVVAASVGIIASADTICPNTLVNFTAAPINGGSNPSYQWKLNGGNVSTNSNIYSNSNLTDGDKVTCVLTSDLICVSNSPATSNGITMKVNPVVAASVSIAISKDTICAGTTANYTATPTNGGSSPAYQWLLNGGPVGNNSINYSNANITNGDKVSCILTSNAACVTNSPDTSNVITMTVNPVLPVSVVVATSQDTICSGTSVNFTATPVNSGTSPAYQWKLNNNNVGTGLATYSNSALANGDNVTCVLTSSVACASQNPATSNAITMKVNPLVTPLVSITANTGNSICNKEVVLFSTNVINGGTSPVYQWMKNGGTVANATTDTYVDSLLTEGDSVGVMVTSNAVCPSPATVTSAAIVFHIVTNAVPQVSISSDAPGTICPGTTINVTASPTNGGTRPAYQWMKNSVVLPGDTLSTYSTSALTSSDTISVVMTSNSACVTTAFATSNLINLFITPNVSPAARVNVSPSNSVCQNQAALFTAQVNNGGNSPTYQWLKNSNPISGATSSTYTDSLLANNDAISVSVMSNAVCVLPATAVSSPLTMQVTNSVNTSATISSDIVDSVCQGQAITFTATPRNGGTTPVYQWKINNVAQSGDTLSTFSSSAIAPGDALSVDITSSLQCVVARTVSSVDFHPHVAANVSPAITLQPNSDTSICNGQAFTFHTTVTNGGSAPVYSWTLNNAAVNGELSSSYTDSQINDGDSVSVSVTSNAGCLVNANASSNTVHLHVIENVTPTISITPDSGYTVCNGQTVVFNSNISNGGTATYQWMNKGVSITNATTSVYTASSFSDGDIISCQLMSTLQCVTADSVVSNSDTFHVFPIMQPVISFSHDTLYSTTANNYQWLLNDNFIPGDTAAFILPLVNGTYKVAVSDSNGCSVSSDNYSLTVLGISKIGLPVGISVYPNPSEGLLYIEATQSNSLTGQVKMYDISGQVVMSIPVADGSSGKMKVDINALQNGIYILSIQGTERNYYTRLVKQ